MTDHLVISLHFVCFFKVTTLFALELSDEFNVKPTYSVTLIRVLVRVVFKGEFAVGFLELVCGGAGLDAQNIVETRFLHHFLCTAPATSRL